MKSLILGILLAISITTSGWATTYDLNHSNLDLSGTDLAGYSGDFAKVILNGSQVTFNSMTNVVFGNHTFDFYLTQAGLSTNGQSLVQTVTTSGYVQIKPGNIDGFGNYDIKIGSSGNAGASDSVTTIAFIMSSAPTLVLNNKDYEVAAHFVIFEDDDFENALATGDITTGGTPPPPPVPEPSTVILLGIGIAGVALLKRRNKQNC